MKKVNDHVAARLLDQKAFKLQPNNPFVWATGMLSPVYFDSRKLLSYPRLRNLLKIELARLIIERYPTVDVIAAVAPSAIALGMLVAETLDLPFVYVTPTPKDHGFENQIEGEIKPQQKVVIVDDQVSFAINCTKVQDVLVKDGSEVLGMVVILNYNLAEGLERLEKSGLQCYSLTHFDNLVDKALELKRITAAGAKSIRTWQQAPRAWKVK